MNLTRAKDSFSFWWSKNYQFSAKKIVLPRISYIINKKY